MEGDSIIIPLHSPDSIVEPLVLIEPSPEENDPPEEIVAIVAQQHNAPISNVSQPPEGELIK